MTMIKGAKTIGEFKIRMFIARHFAEGSVEVEIMEEMMLLSMTDTEKRWV